MIICLNGVVGGLSILENEEDEGKRRTTVAAIVKSANSLERFINDFLDFSAMDSSQYSFKPEKVDISKLIENSIVVFKTLADSKNVKISLNIDLSVHGDFEIDPVRLRQVTDNLISNALKFSEGGEVGISTKYKNGWLYLSVKDEGIGIAPELLDSVFEPYVQAGEQRSSLIKGTGLGLSIVKQIISLMHGEISLQSTKDLGTEFKVKIPIKVWKLQPKVFNKTNFETPALNVLIVDDDEVNRFVFRRILEKNGHATSFATDGMSAIEIIKANTFDLVLMDIHMPVLGGVEATREIRKSKARSHLKIFALTADTKMDSLKGEELFDDILFKPVKSQNLQSSIAKHFSGKKMAG